MKLYTFLDNSGDIIQQVTADSYDEALGKAELATKVKITRDTDFYSESI